MIFSVTKSMKLGESFVRLLCVEPSSVFSHRELEGIKFLWFVHSVLNVQAAVILWRLPTFAKWVNLYALLGHFCTFFSTFFLIWQTFRWCYSLWHFCKKSFVKSLHRVSFTLTCNEYAVDAFSHSLDTSSSSAEPRWLPASTSLQTWWQQEVFKQQEHTEVLTGQECGLIHWVGGGLLSRVFQSTYYCKVGRLESRLVWLNQWW